jgi:hypothetical protein
MKLCPKCGSAWPFVVVFFVAGVSAYLTWLTLAYSELGMMKLIVGSGAVFLAVLGTLLHYVISCMKRHCRHGDETAHQHSAAQ